MPATEPATEPAAVPAAVPMPMITLVHTPACHLCADARDALSEIQREYPFRLELVGFDSPAGQELVTVHRPAMFPLVLVNGTFVSAGRLPRGKLRRFLAGLPAGSVS